MQPYISKHPFQGDPRQSQLSFGPGATILAKPGQGGAWWWGTCQGKEGWFPPTYVTQAPPQAQGGFAPPPPAAFAALQQPQYRQQQQRPAPPPVQTFAPSDPFAGLPTMNSGPNTPTGTAASPTGGQTPPPMTLAASSFQSQSARVIPQQQQQQQQQLPRAAPPQRSASGTALPPKPDATTAALSRLGVSPAPGKNTTPVTSRSASPVPPKPVSTTAPSKTGSKPAPPAAAFAASSGEGMSAAKANTPPVINPQDEAKAKQLRQEEEARQKAQLRQDKAENAKADTSAQERASAVAAGLGMSGVSITTSPDSQAVEVGLPTGSFNPFTYLAGQDKLPSRTFSPIFRVPPFWALMNLNTYIHQQPLTKEQLADRSANYQQLSKALSFVSHVCAKTAERHAKLKTPNPLAYLESNHWACEACIRLIGLIPHSAGASGAALDGLFMNFLNVFLPLLENVQDNQQLVLPGGWQQPDYTFVCLYIIRNCGNNRWSFTVCNTGPDGLQYPPATFDAETGTELKQLAMTVWDIPAPRVLDSTFWTLLFRMQVYPSKKNNAAFLYTKLLPALNSRPLLSNLDQGPSDMLEVPNRISSQSYHPLARLALTTTAATGQRPSKYSTLLVMNAAVQLAYDEIEPMPASSMDPEDTRILKLTGRNLANFASTISPTTIGDGSLGATLSDTWDLLDRLLAKINFAASKPMDQYSHGLPASAMSDDFSKGKIVSLKTGAGSAAHPLFGRLRRDNYEEVVKRLMGDPRPDPILIPAVLTDEELPPVATDYPSAASYLQRVADACSLLLQQRRLIKNAAAFAASASQHALTTVLPMPNADPKFCFWRKEKMRRETQLHLLFLIRRLCRIYSSATACVQQSRGLIAIRSTAFAAAACVSDALCRVVASDDPSAFCLHYSGLCEGPTEPFAIEAGSFDTLGSNLPIYDPNICSLRYQCLDYLRGLTLKKDGSTRHTIFNFDKSLTPMDGDLVLLDQLSIQLALQRPHPRTPQAMRNHSASLIGGRNGSLMEVLPEFEYFRDIVFHFKHAVSGKEQTPEVKESNSWVPSDATLHWSVKRNEENKEEPFLYYQVTAFKGHPQLFVERIAQQEAKTKKKRFQGFLKLFSGKSRMERSRLSSADATTVVNSCGEKFLNKR